MFQVPRRRRAERHDRLKYKHFARAHRNYKRTARVEVRAEFCSPALHRIAAQKLKNVSQVSRRASRRLDFQRAHNISAGNLLLKKSKRSGAKIEEGR